MRKGPRHLLAGCERPLHQTETQRLPAQCGPLRGWHRFDSEEASAVRQSPEGECWSARVARVVPADGITVVLVAGYFGPMLSLSADLLSLSAEFQVHG